MGAGIALEFKLRYPEMFEKYAQYCKRDLIEIGKLWIYDSYNPSRKVLNFPTKRDWKHPSKYEYLEKGLQRFRDTYLEKGITSAAFPLLGAQNGGLDPERVLKIMFTYLEQCNIPIEIYEYDSRSKDDLIDTFTEVFTYSTLKELEKLTGFKKNVIEKLKNIVTSNQINSLIQLLKIKGIGEEVVKSCFQFTIRYKNKLSPYPLNIFPHSVVQEDDSNILHVDALNIINKTSPNVIQETIELIEETPIPIIKPKKEKKKPTKSKQPKVQLIMEEKMLMTGLDEQTILKIESKSENITVLDLKIYCAGLKLSFKTYFVNNYTPPPVSRNKNSKKLATTKSLE